MNETETYDLTGSLGVASIASLHEQMNQALGRECDVRLDLSSVTDVDASAIQLLLAMQKRAFEMKTKFELGQVPACVKDKFVAAGSAELLDIATNSIVSETNAG